MPQATQANVKNQRTILANQRDMRRSLEKVLNNQNKIRSAQETILANQGRILTRIGKLLAT